MIVALVMGALKTIINGLWSLITVTLLPTLFSGFNSTMATITTSTGMKTVAGIVDVMLRGNGAAGAGWAFFMGYLGLVFIVLPLVRLAKFIIGIVTRG